MPRDKFIDLSYFFFFFSPRPERNLRAVYSEKRLNGVRADRCWSNSARAVVTVQPVPLECFIYHWGCCGGCSEGGSLKGMEKLGVTTINELVMKSYLVWHTSRVFTYWNQVFFCSDNFLMIQQAEVFLHPRPLGDFFLNLSHLWVCAQTRIHLKWSSQQAADLEGTSLSVSEVQPGTGRDKPKTGPVSLAVTHLLWFVAL